MAEMIKNREPSPVLLSSAKFNLALASILFNTNNINYKTFLRNALTLIGYALHPIQDKFAHSSEYCTYFGSFGTHIFHPFATDKASSRIDEVIATGEITKFILKRLFNTYPILRRKDIKL